MKQVEKYIPQAVKLIEEKLSDTEKDKFSVPDVYKGYVSSMGASIILSGLVPTLAFYNNDTTESASEKSRRPVLDVLQGLLAVKYDAMKNRTLLDYAIHLQENNDHTGLRRLQREVIRASIAVKLALRSFEMV